MSLELDWTEEDSRLFEAWCAESRERWREEVAFPQQLALKVVVADRLRRAGIPRRSLFEAFETPTLKHQEFLEAVKLFVDRIEPGKQITVEKPSLFLYGPTDSGKTHLAQAALLELIQRGFRVHFCSVPGLYAEIRESYNPENSSESEREIVQNLKMIEVLALDDLVGGTEKEYQLAILFEIIDHRTSKEMPTIITTNLQPEDFRRTFGERIYTRVVRQFELAPAPVQNWRRCKTKRI